MPRKPVEYVRCYVSLDVRYSGYINLPKDVAEEISRHLPDGVAAADVLTDHDDALSTIVNHGDWDLTDFETKESVGLKADSSDEEEEDEDDE